MKNGALRILIPALLLLMVGFAVLTQVTGETNEDRTDYTYTKRVSASLKIVSGVAYCRGEAQGLSNDTNTRVTLILQRKAAGERFKPVMTWNQQGTGKALVMIDECYAIQEGYVYMVKTVSEIVDLEGEVLETETKNSKIKKH